MPENLILASPGSADKEVQKEIKRERTGPEASREESEWEPTSSMFRQKSSTIDWINAERPRAMASSLQYGVIILWCHHAKICNTGRTCGLPAAFAIQVSETLREVQTQKNSVHVRGLYLKHLSDSEYPEISKYEGPYTKHSVPPLLIAPSSTRKVIILAQSIFLSHTRTSVRSVKVARHLRKE